MKWADGEVSWVDEAELEEYLGYDQVHHPSLSFRCFLVVPGLEE